MMRFNHATIFFKFGDQYISKQKHQKNSNDTASVIKLFTEGNQFFRRLTSCQLTLADFTILEEYAKNTNYTGQISIYENKTMLRLDSQSLTN